MKKRSKILALLLAVTMCGSALTGCGADGSKDVSAPKEAASAATKESEAKSSEVASSEVVEPIKNVDIYPLSSEKTFKVVTGRTIGERDDALAQQVWEEGTGISVDWTYWTEDQLRLGFSSGELPDAFFLAYGLTKDQAFEYGQAGYLVNFAEYLDQMPNLVATLESYPDLLSAVINEDGSFYSLPSVSGSATAPSNLLYYRTDMMKEIGWENPPATTDEFLEYISDLQEYYGANDSDYIAFSAYQSSYMKWTGNLARYFFPAFGELVDPRLTYDDEGNVAVGAATEQWKYYLEFMNKIWNSGAFYTDIYTEDGSNSQALAAGGHVGISGTHSGHVLSTFPSGSFDMDVLAPLTSEYWDTQHCHVGSPVAWGTHFMLNAKCEDIETMIKWFDALYSTMDNPINEEGTIWGVSPFLLKVSVDEVKEGTHVLLDTKNKTYKEMEIEGYEYGKLALNEAFGTCASTGCGSLRWSYVSDPNTGVGVKGLGVINNLWPYSKLKEDLLSLDLTDEEADIYADAWTDIDAYIGEMTAKFITGEISIENGWDEYMTNLEKMGVQDVIKIYQAAYDRNLK